MIIEQEKEEVVSNVNSEDDVIKFGIESNEATICLLIKMLANMYPSPKQTLLVEYVQNAMDSHKMAGKADVPIEVTMPNKFDPHYTVRDYGVSMTHEEIKKIYSKALKSLKVENNELVGGYGIGKLVFSPYSGVMDLTTWVGGVKRVYNCRLQGGDGEIRRVYTEKSDEPQGVEVKIPVPESDFQFFWDRASYLYSFLDTKPIIKGVPDGVVNINPEVYHSTDKFTLLKSRMDNVGGAIATIGGMVFPIDTDNMNLKTGYLRGRDESDVIIRSVLNNLPIVLHFDVGEIQHTPSRATLEYNSNTIDAIKNRVLGDVQDFYIAKWNEEISNLKTVYDARLFHSNTVASDSNEATVYRLFELTKKGVTFNGRKIKSQVGISHVVKDGEDDTNVAISSNKHLLDHRNRMETSHISHLSIDEGLKCILIPNGFSDYKRSRRIKKYLIDNPNDHRVVSIKLKDGKTIQDAVDYYETPIHHFIDIETMGDPVTVSKSIGSSSVAPRATREGKILQFNPYGPDSNAIDKWDEVDHDYENSSGVYVLIRYYKPVSNHDTDIDNERMTYHLINTVGAIRRHDPDFILYGIRTSEANKIGKKMISLEEYVQNKINKLKSDIGKDHKIMQSTDWISSYQQLDNLGQYVDEIDCPIVKEIDGVYKKIRDRRQEARDRSEIMISFYNDICNIVKAPRIVQRSFAGTKISKNKLTLRKALASVKTKYPLANFNGRFFMFSDHIEYMNAMTHYRKMKNKS